jgi:murein DD-endopeptidase MepM/ murein hydrolase activator NlpD
MAVILLSAQPAEAWPWPTAATPNRSAEATRSIDRYRPPVDAPVVDPFRPPPQPWMPGNRGIEYGTGPGDVVHAIGSGMVRFAGVVARRSIVTVQHPDGLRSSYVGLARIDVEVGQHLAGGQRVGVAAGPIHLGVRRGKTYLDPAQLWGHPVGWRRSVLVPTR